MAIDKAKRTKAIGALRKAGMSAENAVRHVKFLDLDEPFGPQIDELKDDFPTLFDKPKDDTAPKDTDDKPMTAQEAKLSRLRGEGNPYAFRRKAEPRPSTASKSAQEVAAHVRPKSKGNPPPVQKWREPVRDINGGHAPLTREPSASAKRLADRLRGN
ncbi:hypothetical protein [Streptomyces sp. DH1]|uniref:hypothetical protein n=1 Tax=Streptomyces sp. DH1 TaxID=2857012 RepID=UPI001E4F1B43|nr:hypothetical protein [Streptomyces sp. DH1]